MWYPSTCLAMGLADVRAGTLSIGFADIAAATIFRAGMHEVLRGTVARRYMLLLGPGVPEGPAPTVLPSSKEW